MTTKRNTKRGADGRFQNASERRVAEWNKVFLGTFEMLVDGCGYTREQAVDSARQNANDTVQLQGDEFACVDASDPATR